VQKKVTLVLLALVVCLCITNTALAYDPLYYSVEEQIETSMTGIVAASMDGITATLPLAVPVLGIMAAVGLGLKVFKKLTGRA